MATNVKTPSAPRKAVIRNRGWPTSSKTFCIKRDDKDWPRRIEDETVRGVYIQRASDERMTLESALTRYLREVTLTKWESTRASNHKKAQLLLKHLGKYSLAALSAVIVAHYRDVRLAGDPENGKLATRSSNTVRLELELISHLSTIAIREWALGLALRPASQIRRPPPDASHDRRLTSTENKQLLAAVDTAIRLSETGGLRMGQAAPQKRAIRLDSTRNSSPCTVLITKAATTIFHAALNNPTRPPQTALVLFGEFGRDAVRRSYLFVKAWTDAKRKARLTDFRFHLRHEEVNPRGGPV
ncbi:hypothetical protein LMG26685_00123 [Achromobacter mucicolens]|uniref:site-specific integrase n=1 Tax=Achromobacter mucicolens TaxID=1389922 RepID=UPI0014694C45|nr:hypothetical protein LMG26685_00123 [Achromobacter mucicolens]